MDEVEKAKRKYSLQFFILYSFSPSSVLLLLLIRGDFVTIFYWIFHHYPKEEFVVILNDQIILFRLIINVKKQLILHRSPLEDGFADERVGVIFVVDGFPTTS